MHHEHGDGQQQHRDDLRGALGDALVLVALRVVGLLLRAEPHQRAGDAAQHDRHVHPRQVGALQRKVGLGLDAQRDLPAGNHAKAVKVCFRVCGVVAQFRWG